MDRFNTLTFYRYYEAFRKLPNEVLKLRFVKYTKQLIVVTYRRRKKMSDADLQLRERYDVAREILGSRKSNKAFLDETSKLNVQPTRKRPPKRS